MEQRRFLLAMVLSGIVIFGWQAFFAPSPDERLDEDELDAVAQQEELPEQPDPEDVDPDQVEQPDPVEQPDVDEVDDPIEPDDVEAPEAVDDDRDIEERRDLIKTPDLTVELSNRGAVITNAEITAPDQYAAGSGGNLMGTFEANPPSWPATFSVEEGNLDLLGDEMFELVEAESQRVDDRQDRDGGVYDKIVYRYTEPGGRFTVSKIYGIDDNPEPTRRYALTLDVEIESHLQDGALAGTPQFDIVARDDPDDEDDHLLNFRPDLLEGVCHNTEDIERTAFENLEGYEEYAQHTALWAGTDTRYFIMAAVPLDGASGCSFDRIGDDYLRTRLYHDSLTIQPGGSWSTSYLLYTGAKDFDILTQTGHELNESVDYGLFSFLARPLRWSLARLHGFTANWGLAIILLTLIIKLLTWPITGKAYTSAERMKQIQPQIKEIREKYEDDQQRMTEETMKLFRENDVSPLGCLPLLLQMPILYGLFVMIYNSVELYHAEFLWYADLSAPDPFYALPVLMGAVMFFQQRITMSAQASTNPQMKIVMKVMPVAFTAFMLFLPAGLVLYYLLNLMMGLTQQFLIKRRFRQAEEAGEEV